ncbi:alpha/beta fold hydrolase [Shewanella dokdonensis]|nr:alpha/beta hydrolase [Shewanella dokdonensis]MCL1074435.1 alpha/beta hydrolase [Shewanella dokdonensis]
MYRSGRHWLWGSMLLCSCFGNVAQAADKPAYGAELEGFNYPWPVAQYAFQSQQQSLHMAYMDLQPAKANGHTVVLLHGKNFCGATWEATARSLSEAGYRVVMPDQIGFCKSSKPRAYQYSFQQLAQNTQALLASLSIDKAIIMGHSTGGMLATRYSLMYPKQTEQLVLVNPIGLEDWKAKGVPYIGVDGWYQRELKVTDERIRNYERNTYYAGEWRPAYEKWVQMLAGMYRGPGKEIVAWNSALLYDMIYSQPVYYELAQIQVPTLLLIGEKDTTAPGKDLASAADRAKLGNYPVLAREAAARIPGAALVLFPDYGHAPQMQAPAEFHQALLAHLLPHQ